MNYPGAWLLAALWWGPWRRPFEALTRRLLPPAESRVLSGPLRGIRFAGGLAHRLGIYEIELQRHLVAIIRPGSTFLDVGAHFGFVSLLAARLVGPTGRVFAFEPLDANHERLRQNLAANPSVHGVVNVHPCAVGSETGSLPFAAVPDASPRAHRAGPDEPSILVPVVRLDDVELGPCRSLVLKVDVEGGADAVFAGAARVLEILRPSVVVEVHDPSEKEAVASRLLASRYTFATLPARADAGRPFPHRLVAAPQ